MTQQEPQRYPVIVDELQNQARILNAAAATRDGRSSDAKRQRKMADLLLRAALHIVRLTKKTPPPALPAEPPAVEATADPETHPDEGLPDQPPVVHSGDRDV
jgi:hypothetical protein